MLKCLEKYFISSISVLLVLICGHVQAQKSNLSVIYGNAKASSEKIENIYLFDVIDGSRHLLTSSHLDENGDYAFALNNPKEGLYYISYSSNARIGVYYDRVYVKSGETIQLNILEDGYKDSLIKGSIENITLKRWEKATNHLFRLGTTIGRDTATYHTFFPLLQTALKYKSSFKKSIKTTNKKFNILMSNIADWDIEYASLSMLYTPRREHPNKGDYPAYYSSTFKPNRYCNNLLSKYGDGARLLSFYITYFDFNVDTLNKDIRSKHNNAYKYICNDTLKGIYIASNLSRYKTYESLENAVADSKKYFLTKGAQESYFNALKSLSTFKAGTPGYNFNYPDTSGKKYSLRKELAGKVVYVDLWATWCAPCRAEIPYLKKVEEAFQDQNIAFVSISIDELKDKEKWKTFVKEHRLGGLQLYAGGWGSDITTFYGVKGIPRFMLFDAKGNIVSVDAPRPSNPELKDLLIKTLKSSE